MRDEMGEPYRTLLGHFRHEVGHYYFADPGAPTRRRSGARGRCSATSARTTRRRWTATTRRARRPAGRESHVSAYATMHPAEDWAETFAHVLHIRDTLQTAAAYGLRVDGPAGRGRTSHADPIDAEAGGLRALLDDWLGVDLRLERDQPQPRLRRPVPVRAVGTRWSRSSPSSTS